MRLLHEREGTVVDRPTAAEVQGVAGWVLALLGDWRRQRVVQPRRMKLMETLALGGKRQLMLVSCGEERFLVGGSLDSVETIVQVRAEGSLEMAKNPDEICQ